MFFFPPPPPPPHIPFFFEGFFCLFCFRSPGLCFTVPACQACFPPIPSLSSSHAFNSCSCFSLVVNFRVFRVCLWADSSCFSAFISLFAVVLLKSTVESSLPLCGPSWSLNLARRGTSVVFPLLFPPAVWWTLYPSPLLGSRPASPTGLLDDFPSSVSRHPSGSLAVFFVIILPPLRSFFAFCR